VVFGRLCEEDVELIADEPSRGADGEEILALLRSGIAKRVIHVCAHMSSHDFDAMVASMARIQHKYEVLGTRTFAKAVAI
jgi:hypothetical protein